MPTQPVQPLRTSVKLTFPDGTELTSSFDPVTNICIQCFVIYVVNKKSKKRQQMLGGESMIFQALKACWK
jgi:hypothetical protein